MIDTVRYTRLALEVRLDAEAGMRLATATGPDGPELWGASGTKYHRLTGLPASVPGAESVALASDVGSLLRAGGLDGAREALASLDASSDGKALDQLVLLPPVIAPSAIVCVGRNYAEHVAEGDVPLPPYPLLFSKFGNTLVGHPARVQYPTITEQLDYEGELAIVIGQEASRLSRSAAMSVIAGYTVINDISARDLQDSDMQWIRGKSLDGFAPIGPCVVTVDEIPDPYSLRIQTRVNGELRQDAAVGEMHFRIDEMLEFITAGITLRPGDIVATGTPAGVGLGFRPPRWLQVGDVVDVSITDIGELRAEIV